MFSQIGNSVERLFSGYGQTKRVGISMPSVGLTTSIVESTGSVSLRAPLDGIGSIETTYKTDGNGIVRGLFPNLLPGLSARASVSTESRPSLGLAYSYGPYVFDCDAALLSRVTLSAGASSTVAKHGVTGGVQYALERENTRWDGVSVGAQFEHKDGRFVVASKASLQDRRVTLGVLRPTRLANGAQLQTGVKLEWSKIHIPAPSVLLGRLRKSADDPEVVPTPMPEASVSVSVAEPASPAIPDTAAEPRDVFSCDTRMALAAGYSHKGYSVKGQIDTAADVSLAASRQILKQKFGVTLSTRFNLAAPNLRECPIGLTLAFDS
eukprot:gnl/Trimastix_PCT/1427.p2 GENE.gnl/Trimastix_PCT/1427~~gnl/Trimastix_PCT/1427.p2  ORF type:complete len:323 (+),score=81.68 gnl/Trimastix_PCT/1427:71-1039(+)